MYSAACHVPYGSVRVGSSSARFSNLTPSFLLVGGVAGAAQAVVEKTRAQRAEESSILQHGCSIKPTKTRECALIAPTKPRTHHAVTLNALVIQTRLFARAPAFFSAVYASNIKSKPANPAYSPPTTAPPRRFRATGPSASDRLFAPTYF